MTALAPSNDPDFLSVLQAIVQSDPGAPGIVGRQAIGAWDPERIEWLLLEFDHKTVRTSRSNDIWAAEGFDCVWIFARPKGAGLPPEPGTRTVIDGDRTLLDRFSARYLQTRSHLGYQMERITRARGAASKKGTARL